MNKIIIVIFFSFLILACKEKSIVENEPEKREIDLFAKFTVDDSTYFFDWQRVSSRYLSYVQLQNIDNSPESILIGYKIHFSGNGNYFDFFINKKLKISDLENSRNNTSWMLHSESAHYWNEYEPSQSEFEKMFSSGQREILEEYYLWTKEEGVAFFFNDLSWASYNRHKNVPDENWQVNSKFEINNIEYLNNEEILNSSPDGEFSPIYADTSVNYMLIDLSFDVELFNKEDSTKILNLRDGRIKAVVYK